MSRPEAARGRRTPVARARTFRGLSGRNPGALWWLGAAYAAAGCSLAAALAWPVYQSPRFVVVAAVAIVSGMVLAVVARARRWPAWLVMVLFVIAYLLGSVLVAVPSTWSGIPGALTAVRDTITSVVLGWKQLLTLELPLGEYQNVLAPAFLVFLAGAGGATALATAGRRYAAAAVPVILLLGGFGIAFGPTDPGDPWQLAGIEITAPREVLLGLALVAVSLLWLILRNEWLRRAALAEGRGNVATVSVKERTTAVTVRRGVSGVAMVAFAVVAGLLLAPWCEQLSARTTLRTGVEPRLVVQEKPSPLGDYRKAFRGEALSKPLFTVTGQVEGVRRIALAGLDAWDGDQYRVSADDRFVRLASSQTPAGAQQVDITIGEGFSGIWMPLPSGVDVAPRFGGARAEELSNGFYLDRASGAGLQIAGSGATRGLRAGDSYSVAVVPVDAAVPAEPGEGSLLPADDHPQLNAWLKKQAQPRTSDGFQELVRRLRERGYLSHSLEQDKDSVGWMKALSAQADYRFQASYAGHSRGRVEQLFKDLNDQQARLDPGASKEQFVAAVGDDEQFATAVSLIAQSYGYESRVVLGVRLGPNTSGGVPDCAKVCTGANLAAWVEVRTPGTGAWAAVDADPQFTMRPTTISVNRQLPKNPASPERTDAQVAQPPSSQNNDHDQAAKAAEEDPGVWDTLWPVLRVVGLVLLGLLFLALPVLVIVLARTIRRARRRRAQVPEVAIVGAWQELLDAWTDSGRQVPAGTRPVVANALGTPGARELATLVDSAVFAEHPPGPDLAAVAWELSTSERKALLESQDLRQRWLSKVRMNSFLRALPGGRVRWNAWHGGKKGTA